MIRSIVGSSTTVNSNETIVWPLSSRDVPSFRIGFIDNAVNPVPSEGPAGNYNKEVTLVKHSIMKLTYLKDSPYFFSQSLAEPHPPCDDNIPTRISGTDKAQDRWHRGL